MNPMFAVAVCPVCKLAVRESTPGRCAGHIDQRGLACRGSGWHTIKRVDTISANVQPLVAK